MSSIEVAVASIAAGEGFDADHMVHLEFERQVLGIDGPMCR